jgi:hypothetical protein
VLDAGLVRPQRHERLDCGCGRALGARFEPFADHDQCDPHRRSLEIEVPAGRPDQHQIEAAEISRRRAERDQQVHVAGKSTQRVPGRDVEARADDELHQCRQGESQPCGQHDPKHRQQKRRAQHHGGRDAARLALEAPLFGGDHRLVAFDISGHQLGVITGAVPPRSEWRALRRRPFLRPTSSHSQG